MKYKEWVIVLGQPRVNTQHICAECSVGKQTTRLSQTFRPVAKMMKTIFLCVLIVCLVILDFQVDAASSTTKAPSTKVTKPSTVSTTLGASTVSFSIALTMFTAIMGRLMSKI